MINEVEISRVIFANGENEYYINKKKVRLKDIQELFISSTPPMDRLFILSRLVMPIIFALDCLS